MSFPRYPKYKDSAVDWLGEVPEHWNVKRLCFVADMNPSKSEIAHVDRELLVSFLPMEAVGDDGSLDLERHKSVGDVENGYTYFRDGDVTVAKITPCFENGKGALMSGLLNGLGFGTTELIVARPRHEHITGEYLHAIFRSTEFRALGEAHMYGAGGQKRVPESFVRNFATALPPLGEQTAITAFLARETAKNDELLGEQRRLIELLKEKRQAVISHAVTKGLNPHAPMKPSGIEWLGDVPEHWEVSKMKWVARMESGHTPDKKNATYWENCEIPWVSLNDTTYLKDHDYISDTAYRVNELGIANSSARLLPARVVVFSRDATIGRCAITTRPMAVSQHFIAWVCRESMIPEYLLLRLRSMTQELERLTTGATLKTIGMPDVRTLVTPVPPIEEQQSIVQYVSQLTTSLDVLVAEAEHAIDLLQERRIALISAAVTGKIDVRGLVEADEPTLCAVEAA